ncbi:MAG TPA: hypothetical protein VMS11_04680 [Solirubrobacterales bacterium]|nr:hypothetical protein [Solirubrobacterales bacterium]
MSYRVVSNHAESLSDGRIVAPGDHVSDADAKKNARLIERGVLVKEADRHKPAARKTADGPTPAKIPAPEQGEEDSK